MICKKCGATLLEDDQFCPECGAKVIRKKRCPECGEALREGIRFCPGCGAEVGEGRPAKRTDSEEAPKRRADSEEAPRRRADSEEAPRRRADSEEAPRRRADSAEAPRRKPNPDAPRKKAGSAPPPKRRPVQDERPRRRRDWEEEEWDDDDDEESVDILSIMTVAVGCILLVIVAVLGFNLYQRYVPKNYDKAAEEQEEEEGEEEGKEQEDGEEQEDGQRLEEPPEDSEEEEIRIEASAEGAVVAIADVRIRDNPSTDGTTVITTAKKGDIYEYAEVVEGGHWYKIFLPDEYGYEFGYVSADYVEPQ